MDSQLVVMIAYLINHVLDEPVEIERIRSNTSWVLCWPQLNYGDYGMPGCPDRRDLEDKESSAMHRGSQRYVHPVKGISA